MKIRNEKNKIEIEYTDEEKEMIGNNIMLVQLGADCISLIEPQGLLEIGKHMVKGILVDDSKIVELMKKVPVVIYNGVEVGRALPIYTETRYGNSIPEGFLVVE